MKRFALVCIAYLLYLLQNHDACGLVRICGRRRRWWWRRRQRLNMQADAESSPPRDREHFLSPRSSHLPPQQPLYHFRPGIVPLLPWRIRRPGQPFGPLLPLHPAPPRDRRRARGIRQRGGGGGSGLVVQPACPTNEEGRRRPSAPRLGSLEACPLSPDRKTKTLKRLRGRFYTYCPQYTKVREGEAFLQAAYIPTNLSGGSLTPSPEFTVL